jgi:hypothetical protein
VRAAHECERGSVVGIEVTDEGLMSWAILVVRKQRNQFRRQRVRRRQERRHRGEHRVTVGNERSSSGRHRRATRAQVGHRRGQCIDEVVRIEQPLDIASRQNEHTQMMSTNTARCQTSDRHVGRGDVHFT